MSWFARMFGMPEEAGGIVTSGRLHGQLHRDSRWPVIGSWALGVRRSGHRWRRVSPPTPPTRSTSQRPARRTCSASARMPCGVIPADDDFKLDLAAAEARSAPISKPDIDRSPSIANAGTVATGAVDPSNGMADLCERYGMWMHVDGAVRRPGRCWRTISEATLRRDRARRLDSLRSSQVAVHAAERRGRARARSPVAGRVVRTEATIRPRGQGANRTRAGLRDDGAAAVARVLGIEDLRVPPCARDRRLRRRVSRTTPRLPATSRRGPPSTRSSRSWPRELSICCFRLRAQGSPDCEGRDEYIEAFNRRLDRRGPDGRPHLLLNAVPEGGRFVLRCCIVNYRTEAEHMDDVLRSRARSAPS